MKTTEIRVIPRKDRSRDLVYSEHSSSARSLHTLLQDQSVDQYKFLLKAYREIVGSYLSSHELESPFAYITKLVRRIETLFREDGLALSDLQGMGLTVLLQDRHRFYVLSSDEERIHLRKGDRFLRISSSEFDDIERLEMPDTNLQQELFPQRLRDALTLHRITAGEGDAFEIVLGCNEAERHNILDAVRNVEAGERGPERELVLEFLSRKALYLRFEELAADRHRSEPEVSRQTSLRASWGRVHSGAILFITAVAIIAGAAWLSDRIRSDRSKIVPAAFQTGVQSPSVEPDTRPAADETLPDAALQPTRAEQTAIRLSLVWKNAYGKAVTSSPTISGGRVIFGCRDGKLYAVDAESGALQWSYDASGGIGASPAVSGDRVIGADYRGSVFALDVETGKRAWLHRLPAKIVSSPRILESRIVVGCYDGLVYCLSLEDGRMLWKHETQGRLWGTAAGADDQFVIPSYDGKLYAFSAGTGAVEWTYNIGGELMSSPAISGEAVVVGGPDGRIHAIHRTSGKLLWVFRTGGPVKSSILAVDEKVFIGSHDGKLYCLDIANGSLLWSYKTRGLVLSRPCLADDRLFFGSYDRTFYCLDATTGKRLDAFTTGGKIFSSPAVSGRHVFFGTNAGEFFCLVCADEETS